jgi:hypothetical protein
MEKFGKTGGNQKSFNWFFDGIGRGVTRDEFTAGIIIRITGNVRIAIKNKLKTCKIISNT